MANEKSVTSGDVMSPVTVASPAVVAPATVAPVVDERREREIEAFLDEFAHNDHRRRVLRAAILDKTPVDGGAYFQARLKKIQGD